MHIILSNNKVCEHAELNQPSVPLKNCRDSLRSLSCIFPLTAPTLGLQGLVPPDPMTRLHLKRASPDQEFPNLCGNFTWMARVLTPAMYQRQFHRCTNSGVIFDDIIRPGLEAPGDDVTHSRQSRIARYASTFDFKNQKLCLHEDLKLPALNRIIFQPARLGQANRHPQRKKKLWCYGRGSPVEGSLCFKEQYMPSCPFRLCSRLVHSCVCGMCCRRRPVLHPVLRLLRPNH